MQDAHLLSAWAPSVSDSLAKFLTELHFELERHCFLQFPDQTEERGFPAFGKAFPILGCPSFTQGLLVKPRQLSSLLSVGAGKN